MCVYCMPCMRSGVCVCILVNIDTFNFNKNRSRQFYVFVPKLRDFYM